MSVVIHYVEVEIVYNCIAQFPSENKIAVFMLSGLGNDGSSVIIEDLSDVLEKALNQRAVHIWCAVHVTSCTTYLSLFEGSNLHLVNVYFFYFL